MNLILNMLVLNVSKLSYSRTSIFIPNAGLSLFATFVVQDKDVSTQNRD